MLTLGSTTGGGEGRELTPTMHCLAAVPCPSLCSCTVEPRALSRNTGKIEIPNKADGGNCSQIHEGKEAVQFHFWNICFKFSVQCDLATLLCRVVIAQNLDTGIRYVKQTRLAHFTSFLGGLFSICLSLCTLQCTSCKLIHDFYFFLSLSYIIKVLSSHHLQYISL